MRITIPISGPSKQDRAIQANAQRSINMYAAARSEDAKSDLIMYSHPGRKYYGIAGIGPHRSNPIKWNGKLYWVSGSELFSQDTSGVMTSIGSLLTSGSRVVMVGGRQYLALVDGTYGYSYDGTTFARITDADFPANPTHIAELDGYFIVNEGDTDNFYISQNVDDPTAWSALDFDVSSAKPDKTKGLIVHGKEIYIPGEDTTQLYFNSGNSDFPFTSYPGAIPFGIDAPYSLVEGYQGVFWLGSNAEGDKAVVSASGMQLTQVSDDETTWQINRLATTSDAIGWIRRQGGLSFYELTFPTSRRTWSFSLDSKMPSELKSYGSEKFDCSAYGFFNNKAFVGDSDNGTIYELDFDTHTDNSNAFIRKRVTRVVHKEGLELTFRSLILDAEAGVGLITGQGSDPQVMMRYSWDGGRTWSSELWRSLGAIGKPETKPTWTNLGSGYDWVFEFACSDPVVFALMNLFADVSVSRA